MYIACILRIYRLAWYFQISAPSEELQKWLTNLKYARISNRNPGGKRTESGIVDLSRVTLARGTSTKIGLSYGSCIDGLSIWLSPI